MMRLLPRRSPFDGGLDLPPLIPLLDTYEVRDVPPPERVTVPLALRRDDHYEPLVQRGALVKAGEPIAIIDPDLFVVRAPYGGRLASYTRADTARTLELPAAEIDVEPECDDTQTLEPIDPYDGEQLVRRAHQAGIMDLTDPPTPLGTLLRGALADRVDTLIINAMDSEPAFDLPGCELAAHLDAVRAVATGLHETLSVRRTWLCVDRDDPALWRRVRSVCRRSPIRCRVLRNRYPQSHPVLLALAVARRQVRPGKPLADAGICVIDVRSLIALHEACLRDRPPLQRVVAVAGAVERPGYYRTAVGVSCGHVLNHAGMPPDVSRIIDGRLLTGRSLPLSDAVISPTTDALVVLSAGLDPVPMPGPCVRCGWCQEDCPVGLDPFRLLNRYERGRPADALYPQACIGCGLCSYVCPSELPLTHAAMALRQQAVSRRGAVS